MVLESRQIPLQKYEFQMQLVCYVKQYYYHEK